MNQLIAKVLVTALVVVAISELSKRSSFAGAVLASLPMTSILAFVWLYYETRDNKPLMDLSMNIFWLVIPSLAFFPLFAVLLKTVSFWTALAVACVGTAILYAGYVGVLAFFGISLS